MTVLRKHPHCLYRPGGSIRGSISRKNQKVIAAVSFRHAVGYMLRPYK
ncbi:hypothetical protein H6G82_20370 [Planktothricoides sp. FACHB-1261]|nr:hypothetical protein [Planktothricoides sp. SR001]MBD2584549.1 hypothetical protein [Planktothricoides raciborskii FACHB-1261]